MLSTILHKHLDGMDQIEADVKAEADKIIAAIDRQKLISDPRAALMEVAEEVAKVLEAKYIPIASKDGFALARQIEKKDVVIDPSKDPNKNEGLAND